MARSLVYEKGLAFAIRVVKLYQFLCDEKREFVMSKQLLRAGTSIGANCSEAKRGQSDADFVTKLTIALKEADETLYWLELLCKSGYLSEEQRASMAGDCEELVRMLVAIIRSTKRRMGTL